MLRAHLAKAVRFLFTRDELERRSGRGGWDGPDRRGAARPERLPLPHVYKPNLGLKEALAATIGAFLRIVLGSVMFAVWGACSLAVWGSFRSLLLRLTLLGLMLGAFLVTFTVTLLVLRALFRPRPR